MFKFAYACPKAIAFTRFILAACAQLGVKPRLTLDNCLCSLYACPECSSRKLVCGDSRPGMLCASKGSGTLPSVSASHTSVLIQELIGWRLRAAKVETVLFNV